MPKARFVFNFNQFSSIEKGKHEKAPLLEGLSMDGSGYLPIFGGSRKAIAKKRVEMARARIRM
jgi:hypothetical protein